MSHGVWSMFLGTVDTIGGGQLSWKDQERLHGGVTLVWGGWESRTHFIYMTIYINTFDTILLTQQAQFFAKFPACCSFTTSPNQPITKTKFHWKDLLRPGIKVTHLKNCTFKNDSKYILWGKNYVGLRCILTSNPKTGQTLFLELSFRKLQLMLVMKC